MFTVTYRIQLVEEDILTLSDFFYKNWESGCMGIDYTASITLYSNEIDRGRGSRLSRIFLNER